jgi:hypothetical protein
MSSECPKFLGFPLYLHAFHGVCEPLHAPLALDAHHARAGVSPRPGDSGMPTNPKQPVNQNVKPIRNHSDTTDLRLILLLLLPVLLTFVLTVVFTLLLLVFKSVSYSDARELTLPKPLVLVHIELKVVVFPNC